MKNEEIKKQYEEMLSDWEEEATVPEAVNQLLSTIKGSLPYWEHRIRHTDFDENELIAELMTRNDENVKDEFKNLIIVMRKEHIKKAEAKGPGPISTNTTKDSKL